MQQSDQESSETHKHIAVLLWRFSQAPPNSVGTTNWRKLIPPPDRTKVNSPLLTKHEVFPTMPMDNMVDEMTTTNHEDDSHGFFLDHGTHLPEYYPSTSHDLLGHVEGAFDYLNNYTAFPDTVFNMTDPHIIDPAPHVDDLVMQDFNHLQYNLQAHGHNGMFTAPLDAMTAGGSNYFDTEIQRAYSQPIINPNTDQGPLHDTQLLLHHTQSLSQPMPSSSYIPHGKHNEDDDDDDEEAGDLETVPSRRPLTTFDLTTHQILQAQLNQSPTRSSNTPAHQHQHQPHVQPAVTQSFNDQLLASLSTNPPTANTRPQHPRATSSQPQPYLDRDSDQRYWHVQSQLLPDFDMSPLAPTTSVGPASAAATYHLQSPSNPHRSGNPVVTQYAAPVPTRPLTLHSHASYLTQQEQEGQNRGVDLRLDGMTAEPRHRHELERGETGLTQDMCDIGLTTVDEEDAAKNVQEPRGGSSSPPSHETGAEHDGTGPNNRSDPNDGDGDVDHELVDANHLVAMLGAHNAAIDAQGTPSGISSGGGGELNGGFEPDEVDETQAETAIVLIKEEE